MTSSGKLQLAGNGNRVSERLRGIASDMRNIGASTMTPHELFAYWAREVDKAADLATMLGARECHIVKSPSDSDFSDDWRYRCSECGCNIPVNERDPETGDVINAANYCSNCGRKVKQ